jgi:signal transduction histidine kinase
LEDAEFDLGRELEGLIDMFSVQCTNHNVEAVLDLSGTCCALNVKYQHMIISLSLSVSDVHCYLHFLHADEMPKLLRGDSARVVQIFANLISNSIKFTTSKSDTCSANLLRF